LITLVLHAFPTRRSSDLDLLLPVEGVLPPHVDMCAGELDHVVTGPCLSPQPQRRHRAGVDDEEILEAPGIGDVLVPGEDEVHARDRKSTRLNSRHQIISY